MENSRWFNLCLFKKRIGYETFNLSTNFAYRPKGIFDQAGAEVGIIRYVHVLHVCLDLYCKLVILFYYYSQSNVLLLIV